MEQETADTTNEERGLYRLILNRAITSQLGDAVFAVVSMELTGAVDGKAVHFKAQGRRLIEPGGKVVFGGNTLDAAEDETEPESLIPKL